MIMPAATTEYVFSTLTGDHDFSGQTVEVALPQEGQAPATWLPATLTQVVRDTDDAGNPLDTWTGTFRLLIGPEGGAFSGTAGSAHDWWSKLHDNPEVPVRKAGQVEFT